MRRVLMVSPHFPPDSAAGTHRVRLLAPHLARYGWEPTVLTVDPRDYEGALDPALGDSVPSSLRVVRARAWRRGFTRPIGFGDLGLRAFAGLTRAATALLAAERFEAVFVTIYPTYPALLGPRLKRRFGVAFVLDYQDPWVGEWGRSVGPLAGGRPDLRSRLSRALASRLEPHALRAADAVTAVSQATIDQALVRTPDAVPRVTDALPIGWDRGDLTSLQARRGVQRVFDADDGLFHVVYVGTLLPAGYDTLRMLLGAVAKLRAQDDAASRLRLHFYGTSNERTPNPQPRVEPIARELGVADVVTELPRRLDYFDALQVLTEASAVLLLGSSEPHYTPSKVFPAMLSRRPLLALLHEASAATAFLSELGRAPSIRFVTYGSSGSEQARSSTVEMLRSFLNEPSYADAAVDWSVAAQTSACALAGRLARVLDAVTPCRA